MGITKLSLVLLLPMVLNLYGCHNYHGAEVGIPSKMEKITKLAKQYKKLRERRDLINKSGGALDDDLSRWDGLFHNTLSDLGMLLGNPSFTKTNIINIMGKPDEIRKSHGNEELVYYWRGGRDYLFFVCKDSVVQKHDWYFAFE